MIYEDDNYIIKQTDIKTEDGFIYFLIDKKTNKHILSSNRIDILLSTIAPKQHEPLDGQTDIFDFIGEEE